MTELIRWVDDDATDAEQQLLGAARGDAPPAGKRDELLTALGVGTALAAGAAVAGVGAAGSATALASAAAGTPAAKAMGAGVGSASGAVIGSTAVGATTPLIGIVKWIGIGLFAGAVTSGSLAAILQHSKTPELTSAVTTDEPVSVQPLRTEPLRVERDVPPPPEPSQKPSPTSSASAPPDQAETQPTDVAAEVATLDSARQALRSGDARRALKTLVEHARRFSGGVLGPEAELLRIEALIESGQPATAASRARSFLAKNPSSPHTARVRSLLARAAAPPEGTPAPTPVRSTASAEPPAPPASPSTPSTASFPAQ